MTFPGVAGVVGPKTIMTPTAQQIRQSRAGGLPGQTNTTSPALVSVVDAWGSHAPSWAVAALAAGGMEAYADEPRPIEEDNFELAKAYGGTDQFGVDPTSPSDFEDNADPGYTGE